MSVNFIAGSGASLPPNPKQQSKPIRSGFDDIFKKSYEDHTKKKIDPERAEVHHGYTVPHRYEWQSENDPKSFYGDLEKIGISVGSFQAVPNSDVVIKDILNKAADDPSVKTVWDLGCKLRDAGINFKLILANSLQEELPEYIWNSLNKDFVKKLLAEFDYSEKKSATEGVSGIPCKWDPHVSLKAPCFQI
jgi:hypothetical protein